MERGFIKLNVAVLAIGDAPTIADEPSAQLIVDRFSTAGHKIVAQAVVGDFLQAIRAKLLEWVADPNVDVVLAVAGTRTEYGAAALAPLVTKPLVGFSDLFRYMTFEEIGTAAMLVDADAAQCKSTFVFLLPSSIGAVRTALDRLIIPQLDYRTQPANLVMRMPRVAHVDVAEVPEPEPWITPKKPTAQIVGVPAPPKPPKRAGTIPPPLPSVSMVRKIEAVPQYVAKETTTVGAAPAPAAASRPKISTISTPLPTRLPAAPAPFVEELEATPPKTREFEAAEMTGPLPRTPTPSVMVDATLSQPIIVVARPRPITANTSRPIDESGDEEGFTTYAPNRTSRKLLLAWASIALAAAAMLLVFILLRKPDKDAQVSEPPPPPGDRVAARTPEPETRSEPPPPPPPAEPVVVVTPDAPVDDEIDMPLEPDPVKPVVAKTAKTPVVAKEPVAEKEPELTPVTVENGCDEVSCALDRYQQACCAKYKPAEEPVKPTPTSDVPEKINRAMIVEGVGRVKPAVVRCGEVHSTRGTVKLQVKVTADGKVDDVTVASTPDEQLGSCVATAVQKATFGKTQNGGSFGYPFVF